MGQSESLGTPAPAPRPQRSAEQIRRDIAAQQQDLGRSVEALRGRVVALTDWRRQVHEHKRELIACAAVTGFVVGGILALRRRN